MLMLQSFVRHHRTSLPASSVEVRRRRQRGQATAEYALVILGAAALAGLVLAWAASTGKISRLLNAVLDSVIGQVG